MIRPSTASAAVVRTLAQLMYHGCPGCVRGQATLTVSKMIHNDARYVTGAPHRPRVNGPGRHLPVSRAMAAPITGTPNAM